MIKNRENQDGIAHLLLIVLFVAVVGVIGFVGYTVSSKDKSKNASSSASVVSNKEVESTCNKELKDKDLCKFASNYNLDNVDYKAVISSATAEGTSNMTMEVDANDNSSITISENGKETYAMIYLDKTSYIKNASDGTWLKYPKSTVTDTTEKTPDADINIQSDDFTSKSNYSYKKIGKERCGKLNCFKYEVTDKTKANMQQFIWFDDDDYVLQRYSVKEGSDSSDMTFTFKDVTITAPSPVKDYPSASSADVEAAMQAAQSYSQE